MKRLTASLFAFVLLSSGCVVNRAVLPNLGKPHKLAEGVDVVALCKVSENTDIWEKCSIHVNAGDWVAPRSAVEDDNGEGQGEGQGR